MLRAPEVSAPWFAVSWSLEPLDGVVELLLRDVQRPLREPGLDLADAVADLLGQVCRTGR